MRRFRLTFRRWGSYHVREVTRGDVIDLLADLQSEDRATRLAAENELVVRCVDSVDPDLLPAGVVSRLASEIFRLSGAEHLDRLQQEAQSWAQSVDGRLEILAMSYLGYRLSEIWSLSLRDWQYVAVAASLAASLHGVDVARFVHREEYEEARKQATVNQMRLQSQVAQPVSYHTPSIEKEFEFRWSKQG